MAESSKQKGIGRRWLAAPILAAAALLCLASHAGAATVNVGQIAPMGPTGGCGGCTYFQTGSDPASPSYQVPPGGPWTMTSWSSRGGSMADFARLRIFRPTAVAGQYELVAESADVAIGPVEAPVTPVSIPVLPRDVIGLWTQGSGDIAGSYPSALAADRVSFPGGGPVLVGNTLGPGGDFLYATNAASFTNVAATLFAPDPVEAPPAQVKKCKGKKKAKPRAGAAKKKKKKCRRKKGKRKG